MHKDDFEVISTPVENARAVEILFTLVQQRGSLPIAEIKKRANAENEFLALANSAIELAATESNVLFRKRDDADSAKASIWLASVLSKAREIALLNWDNEFHGITPRDLRRIATLSTSVDSIYSIQNILLKEYGIILVIAKAYSSMKLDGAVTRLSNGIPVIGLSLRYSRYDNFWFTLLHELAHISLHYDQLSAPILDDLTSTESEEVETEIEANRLAADSIVPRKFWAKASIRRSVGTQDITDLHALANQAEVHPALVAGLVRRSTSNYSLFSKIINEIDTRRMLGLD